VNDEPRHAQLAVGPLVATAGAVLLVVSLFLDWYEKFSAFTVFEFNDLLLTALAIATVVLLARGLGMATAPWSPGIALVTSILAVLVVLSQILNHPPAANGLEKSIGIWLGLSGSALMVAGAILGYAHISLAVETRPRTTAPPPSAPPPPRADQSDTERL
jgi:hypothetical protein